MHSTILPASIASATCADIASGALHAVLRVLIVEDEQLARQRLERLVHDLPGLDLVASCGDGDSALAWLEREHIDIALLDIAMPGVDGLGLGAHAMARGIACIYTTASSDRAAEAFGVEAVDFLVKPFARERLELAFLRARSRIVGRDALNLTARLRQLLDPALPPSRDAPAAAAPAAFDGAGHGRFLVRHDGRMTLVREAQIDWIQADGKQCLLHLPGKTMRAGEGFSAVLGNLSPALFLQVSRSVAVNTDRIREIHELFKGNVSILMAGGQEIAVSRRLRGRVLARLGARV